MALVVLRATISGLVVKAGLFAWPMFSSMSMASFRVWDHNGTELNQWDHLIHADIGMTRAGADLYLEYLRAERAIPVQGAVTMFEDSGITTHEVRDGHAVWHSA